MGLKKIILLSALIVLALSGCKTSTAYKKAVKRFETGEYSRAVASFRTATRRAKTPEEKGKSNYYLGECYRLNQQNIKALSAYRAALRYKFADSIIFLQMADVSLKMGNTRDAKTGFKIYLEKHPESQRAINGIISCDSLAIWAKETTGYKVELFKSFNSRKSEACPVIVGKEADLVYFNSTRDGGKSLKTSRITGLKNNDIYSSRIDSKGRWLTPEPLVGPINTPDDEGAVTVSPDGKVMYYSICRQIPGKSNGVEIYRTERSGALWGAPQKFKIFTDSIADSLVLAHPALSADENVLFFASDLKGGYGGKDIWFIKKMGDKWTDPENAGPQINTSGDELYPVVRGSNRLYFASNGHPGFGGLDLFCAVLSDSGQWHVSNMGIPINSNADDFGITFAPNEERGFFTSNRADKIRGYDHIYSFIKPEAKFELSGIITDSGSGNPLPDANIRIIGNDGSNEKYSPKRDGKFTIALKKGVDYVYLVSAKGYLNDKAEVSTTGLKESKIFTQNFSLTSVRKPVRLNNIFFEFGKWDVTTGSAAELDKLVKNLSENANISIEISAHTDMVGNDAYNLDLSAKRAQSVVNYLISKGINSNRLTSKGYGKSVPVSIDKEWSEKYKFLKEGDVLTPEFILTLPLDQQEIANQINRRTEFRVTSTSFKAK